MNSFLEDFKKAIQETQSEANRFLTGELDSVFGLLNGVIKQNIVFAQFSQVAVRDVQRLVGAYRDHIGGAGTSTAEKVKVD